MEKALKLNTGYMMPTIALGCWQSEPNVVGEAVKTAIRAGYRHIDTAQNYLNEAEIGEAIHQLIADGEISRKDVFITTKLGMAMMHPTHVEKEFRRSLKALKVEYIDLFLLHTPFACSDEGLKDEPRTQASLFPMYSNYQLKLALVDYVDTYKEMEKLVKTGLVRSIGVSNFSISQIERIIKECEIVPANLQNECHVWYQTERIVQFCKNKGITFSAYSPIGYPAKTPSLSRQIPNLLELPLVLDLAKKHKKSAAQILLRFLLQRGLIVLPKSTNPERIKQNIDLFDFEINADDMKQLKALDKNTKVLDISQMLGPVMRFHPFLDKQLFNITT